MSNKLDQIQIPVPCPTDWEEMAGNDRVRYCAECKKNVYNLSKMTRHEADALIATKRGNLCARIVRNPDGTILTETLPAIMPADCRRASPVAAALVTAIIGLSPNVVAHTSSVMRNPAPGYALESRVNRFSQIETESYSLKADGFATAQYQDLTVEQGEQQQSDVNLSQVASIYPLVSQGETITVRVSPLRQLFDKSELVVVARAGESVRVEAKGEANLMKTRLQISSTHKGAQRARIIDLYHWVYGEKDEIYNRGGNLLLFLRNRQFKQRGSRQGYELVDSMRGIKELHEADLQTYLQRIDELAAITSKGEPDREEIVEWLVRCAEQPATRWDGVYDLELNAETLAEGEIDISTEETVETEEAEEQVDESEIEPAEEASEEEAAEAESEDEDSSDELFAKLLTAAQKERLSQALFSVQTITADDIQFIELVRRWDDGRLIPFLLSQLRQMEANPPRVAEQIVGSIANWLEDEEVMGAYDHYSKNVSHEDEGEDIDGSEDVEAGKTRWVEARRNRGDMLREFITLVETKIKK